MKRLPLFQTLKVHDLPPEILCLPPVPEETWILIKKDAKQNTNLKREKNIKRNYDTQYYQLGTFQLIVCGVCVSRNSMCNLNVYVITIYITNTYQAFTMDTA